jgi:hypothetical protein
MIPVETISGMGEGMVPSMIYLILCTTFCKWHNVPSPSKTILKKENSFGTVLILKTRLVYSKQNVREVCDLDSMHNNFRGLLKSRESKAVTESKG